MRLCNQSMARMIAATDPKMEVATMALPLEGAPLVPVEVEEDSDPLSLELLELEDPPVEELPPLVEDILVEVEELAALQTYLSP